MVERSGQRRTEGGDRTGGLQPLTSVFVGLDVHDRHLGFVLRVMRSH